MWNPRRLITLLLPAILLLGCASHPQEDEGTTELPAHPAWQPAPPTQLPYGTRVGIMTVLDNELQNVHAGTLGIGNQQQSFTPDFYYPGYAAESLRRGLLANTPYNPVIVPPTGRLMRDKLIWQNNWSDKHRNFGEYQAEFDSILKQNQLGLLIVISAPESSDGIVGTRQTVQGSGIYTRDFFGKHQTAVFTTMHFYRVGGPPARLLQPVSAPDERRYADLERFPDELPDPMPAPMEYAVENAVKQLIDQKVSAFIPMMK